MSETTRRASCNCGKLSLTYKGPDPDRISLCQCYECQKRTGSVASVQARLPVEHVTIEGQSTTWTFPSDGGEPVTFRSCDSGGPPTISALSAVRPFTGRSQKHRISSGSPSAPSPTRRFRRR
jgi:hypothetical protein